MNDFAADWQTCTIESLCERVTSGGTPSRRNPAYFENGTIDWYKTGELRDRRLFGSEEKITQKALDSSSAKLFPKDTVLLALYGDGDTITTLGLLKKPGATNQACCAMLVNHELADATYVFYALKNTREALLQRCVGGAQRNLSGRLVKEHMIPCPTLDEQRAIAGVLGALDDKIDQNRRTAAKLEELARATFRAWFIDFAPVHAKAAGATSYPGLPPEAFAALPTTFQPSPLSPIPEGWTCESLDALAKIIGGGTPKRSNSAFWGPDIPWYSVKDAPEMGQAWVIATDESITEAGLDGSSARLLPEAGVIISARGTVGRLALTGVPMAFNQSCYGLVATEKSLPFILHQAMQQAVVELQQRTHGSVFDTITRKTFERVELAWPPRSIIKIFEEILTPSYLSMRQQLIESRKLTELRDYLLPRLLSGAVRVRDAEEMVSAGEGVA